MQNTFIIIDDDISIVTMLKSIIKNNNLGRVVAEFNSGEHVVEEILFYNPSIVLIDYLLPSKDGLEIIHNIINQGYKGKIIMISQVEDETMVANAYNTGILFFIKKPINMIEVINVIKTAAHSIELERSMSIIKGALGNISGSNDNYTQNNNQQTIENILSDIGIIGDPGSKDLIKLVNKIIDGKRKHINSQYKLQEIYIQMSIEESGNTGISINPSTVEQRIRRTIQKSLVNIAEFGLDDYYNPKFMEYSTLLFDFSQVKQEMNYIQGITKRRGTLNTRKFIEGIISKIS